MERRTPWRATLGAGIVSASTLIFERLALTDIFHGEPDLGLEWTVVNVSLLPMVAFHLLAIAAAASELGARARARP